MSLRRRFLKILGWGVSLLALGLLWAFGTFFFYPWEDDYGADVAGLIPRDVDFYVAKGELARDFEPFPHLPFLEELLETGPGRALVRAGWLEGLGEGGLEARLREVETQLEALPVRLDPLSVFGGKDLALAGYFEGTSLEQADWAVYGRLNALGKIAYEVVENGWADLAAQGLNGAPLEVDGRTVGFTLSGGGLVRPLHVSRILDVLVATPRVELVEAARRLWAGGGEDSLLLSAKYGDHIGLRDREGDELEVYLDQRALAESLRLPGTWPDARSKNPGVALLGRFFQIGVVREVAGTLGFGRNLHLQLDCEISSNLLTPIQKRLYRERGFEREDILEVARWAPADAGLFAYLHVDLADLLREFVASLDPATLSLIEDQARSVWGYADVYPLLDDIAAAFRDRIAFFARTYDYPDDPREPPRDGVPVPAWAVVLWVETPEEVDRLRETIQTHQAQFGLRGHQPGEPGVFHNQPAGGALLTEYWNPLIPGTGHLATLEDQGKARYLILSNENRFLGQIFRTYHTGAPDRRLADHPVFHTWVGAGLASANALVWFDPRALGPTLRRMARYQGRLDLLDAIDWDRERPRIEREVLARDFPGEVWGAVSPSVQAEYEARVQEALDAFQEDFERTHAGQAGEEAVRVIRALEITSGTLLELATDPKRFQIAGRIGLEPEGGVPGTGLEPARE